MDGACAAVVAACLLRYFSVSGYFELTILHRTAAQNLPLMIGMLFQ